MGDVGDDGQPRRDGRHRGRGLPDRDGLAGRRAHRFGEPRRDALGRRRRVEARPAGAAPPRVRHRPAPVPRHAPRPAGAARRPRRDPRPPPEPAPRPRRRRRRPSSRATRSAAPAPCPSRSIPATRDPSPRLPNIIIHCSRVRGRKTMFVRRTSPIGAFGSAEYMWPGYSTVSSGTTASFWVRLSYSASGSPPGRSVRPQLSRNSVSPLTSLPSTKKHCEPGVCPGVWMSVIGIVADVDDVARRVQLEVGVGAPGDALDAPRLVGLHVQLRVHVGRVRAARRCRRSTTRRGHRRRDRGDSA